MNGSLNSISITIKMNVNSFCIEILNNANKVDVNRKMR